VLEGSVLEGVSIKGVSRKGGLVLEGGMHSGGQA